MEVSKKAAWKCAVCVRIKGQNQKVETQKTLAPSPQNNVTVRKQYKSNIPTENSFEALSFDEEVEDLSLILENDSKLNRSCPNLQPDHLEKIEKLQKQISELTIKLEIADNEILNLLSENSCLKKQVATYDTQVSQLKDICKSTPKKQSQKINRNSMNKTKLDFSIEQHTPKTLNKQLLRNEAQGAAISKEKKTYITEINLSNIMKNNSEFTINNLEKLNNRKNVIIIGDEQVKGLAAKMTKTTSGRFKKYNFQGIVKPNAPSCEFLADINNIVSRASEEDIVILSVGNNDRDPFKLLMNVCNALNKLKVCKVLLLNVYKNQLLNVNELNYEFKRLVKDYGNCKFIKIKDLFAKNGWKMPHVKLTTARLNFEFEQLEYDSLYSKNDCKYIKNPAHVECNISHDFETQKQFFRSS